MKDLIQYKSYYGSVHFDDEESLFYGKIEFIRALVTYEATDARGLRQAFEESVDDYLETCHAQNIAPEVPFKGSLNVRLGPDLHRRVALAAEQHHSTINKFIVNTLDRAMKKDPSFSTAVAENTGKSYFSSYVISDTQYTCEDNVITEVKNSEV